MNVTVRLFAGYADSVGSDRVTVVVSEPVTAGAVRAAIAARFPSIPPRPIVAVNEEYATDDAAIGPGDVVAVIPPVAGG